MTETRKQTEHPPQDLASIYVAWWHRLVGGEGVDTYQALPRAYAAVLKRCTSLDEVMMTEPFQDLWFALPESARTPNRMVLTAILAAILAHIKKNSDKNLARSMAERASPEGSTPKVSQLRFQQLIKARDYEEFVRRFRRIVMQLGGEVSVASTVRDIENWYWQNRPEHGSVDPKRRQTLKWAMDYYQALPRK